MTETADHIIKKYYPANSLAYSILYPHSVNVTRLALLIADNNPHLNADRDYLKLAGMLHDIGIFKTNAPDIGCHGEYPYVAHTYLGRKILEDEGLMGVAPICERHIGVGISAEEILSNKMPLPARDMLPKTPEEKIICYADKFFSKNPEKINRIKTTDKIIRKLSKHGDVKAATFRSFMEEFGWEYIRHENLF